MTRRRLAPMPWCRSLIVLVALGFVPAALPAAKGDEPPAVREPWLFVDHLLSQGLLDEARAFAQSVPAPEGEGLRRYLLDPPAEDRDARVALMEGIHLRTDDPEQALHRIHGVEPAPGSMLEPRVHLLRAWCLERTGELEQALTESKAAAEASRRLGWNGLEEKALELAMHSAPGRSDAWREAALRRLEIHDLRGRAADGARMRTLLARQTADAGDLRGALAMLEAAEASIAGLGEPAVLASLRNAQGLIEILLGRLARAAARLGEAREAAAAAGDAFEEMCAHRTLGTLAIEIGDFALARSEYEKALDLAANEALRGEALGNLGDLELREGKYEDALRWLTEAQRVCEEADDSHGMAIALATIGQVAMARGKHEEAMQRLDEASRLGAVAPWDAAGIQGLRAEALAALGRHAEAMRTAEEAFRRAEASASPNAMVEALSVRARLRAAAGDLARALDDFRTAHETMHQTFRGLADAQVTRARGARGSLVEEGIAAAVGKGDAPLAFEFIERGRARALLDSMGGRDALQGIGLSDELAVREAKAQADLRTAREVHALAREQGKPARLEAARVEDALAAFEMVRHDMHREAAHVASVTYPEPATLERVEAALGAHAALVLYAVLPDRTHALVVGDGPARLVDLGPTKRLGLACEQLRRDVAREPATSQARVLADSARKRLGGMRGLLLDPLALTDEVGQVLVVPDGPLAQVPFPLLVRDDVAVALIPSATAWLLLRTRGEERGGGVLALGDPVYAQMAGASHDVYARGRALHRLHETADEVREIAGADVDRRLLRLDATEAGLRGALAGDRRWHAVHFACHGILHERATLSSLALTPQGDDDGFLTALEIFGLNVRADLVVLSACDTAGERLAQAEGVVGLVRSFMVAGAPRVVAGLWKAPDRATRHLMARFYENWRGGADVAQALRMAQDAVRKDPENPQWRHPYYWAGWVVWGLPTDVEQGAPVSPGGERADDD